MKRRAIARIAVVSGAWCAATVIFVGASAWAKQTAPPAETVPAADDAQIDAAKKEVQAYKTAYRAMEKESGPIEAMRFFLTPDYKYIDVTGKIKTREQLIGSLEKYLAYVSHNTAAKAPDAKPQPAAKSPNEKPVSLPFIATETYTVHDEAITVVENRDDTFLAPTASTATVGATSEQHSWRTLQVTRLVYRRTPKGLRLQEEAVVSIKRYLDGKFDSELPVPKPDK